MKRGMPGWMMMLVALGMGMAVSVNVRPALAQTADNNEAAEAKALRDEAARKTEVIARQEVARKAAARKADPKPAEKTNAKAATKTATKPAAKVEGNAGTQPAAAKKTKGMAGAIRRAITAQNRGGGSLSPIFAHHAQRYFRLEVSAGRIAMIPLQQTSFRSSSSGSGGRREQLTVQTMNGPAGMQLNYEQTSSTEQTTINVGQDSFQIVHKITAKDDARPNVEFVQSGREPLRLTVTKGAEKTVHRGATIWHLLLEDEAVCKEHLLPYLKTLRPDWDLPKQAQEVEAALVRAAATGAPPDRKRWTELVSQLGDDQYSIREAADRELRKAGRRAAGFLENLKLDDLDAEQRMRIRRIVNSAAVASNGDSPGDTALELVEDQAIWLILLGRDAEPTRRAAVKQLESILGRKIAFDPAAAPDARAEQLATLRKSLGQPPAQTMSIASP